MTLYKRLRIAIIIPGGIGTGTNNMGVPVLENHVKLLAKDFDVTVFSLFKVNDDYDAKGFELVSINSNSRVIKALNLFLAFWMRHRAKKFDVIHGFWILPSGLSAVVLGKLFRVKSLVTVQGGDAIALPEINYGQLRGRVSKKMVIWTLHHADIAIALTRYQEMNLKKSGLKKPLKIIPFGIDTELFSYHEKSLGNTIRFLHIGNLMPVKDQITLLRAFKIISDSVSAHLTLIGTGSLEESIRTMIKELLLDNKITIVAPVQYQALPTFYHNADILLHTSLFEGQPIVAAEAMAAGVVICGTCVGLLYDLPDCCVSVAVRDHEALARETLKLIKDSARMRNLRLNACQWAAAHSILWTTAKAKEFYYS